MSLELTSNPTLEDESKVVEGTRAIHPLHMPKDVESLCLFDRLESGEIIAGLPRDNLLSLQPCIDGENSRSNPVERLT